MGAIQFVTFSLYCNMWQNMRAFVHTSSLTSAFFQKQNKKNRDLYHHCSAIGIWYELLKNQLIQVNRSRLTVKGFTTANVELKLAWFPNLLSPMSDRTETVLLSIWFVVAVNPATPIKSRPGSHHFERCTQCQKKGAAVTKAFSKSGASFIAGWDEYINYLRLSSENAGHTIAHFLLRCSFT